MSGFAHIYSTYIWVELYGDLYSTNSIFYSLTLTLTITENIIAYKSHFQINITLFGLYAVFKIGTNKVKIYKDSNIFVGIFGLPGHAHTNTHTYIEPSPK